MLRAVNVAVGIVLIVGYFSVAVQGQEADEAVEVPRVVKAFSLQHASAEEMQRILVDLFDNSVDLRQAAFARARGPRIGISGIRTSSDPRTNSLIITGPKADLEVIEVLIMKLDVPTPEKQERLENSTAAKLRERLVRLERIVDRLMTSTNRARAPQSDRGRSSRAPAPPSPGRPAAVILIPDDDRN